MRARLSDELAHMTASLMDFDKTLAEFGGDETLFGRIAQTFTRTAPALLSSIAAALAGSDLKRAYTESHSLKGSVGVFQAPEVFASVSDVSRLAKEGNLAAARNAFATAQPLVERLLTEVASVSSRRSP